MALKRVPLLSGAYHSRSLIASAQECVNLYPENNVDPQSPVPVTTFLTPGSVLFGQAPLSPSKVRCTYRTSIGTAYAVVGPSVYAVSANGAMSFIGSIADRPSQVIMSDNGLAVVLVDGSNQGWAIDMASNAFGAIIDPSFYGGSHVAFLDTFFIFNRPDTNQFYISLSMVSYTLLTAGTSFDPLDIAAKAGSADPIVAIAVAHRELWLIGELTTEVWVGTGSADFYFQLQQGGFIDHGCLCPYSVVTIDTIVAWISQDKLGKAIIVQGSGYQIKEMSKPGVVAAIQRYDINNDAIGFCFQVDDHAFVGFAFPTANVTWLTDLTTGEWMKWSWLDDNGISNRHRANCAMFAFGFNIVGDWETGILWKIDATVMTDGNPDDPEGDGMPIKRLRTWPHLIVNGVRVLYHQFIADMECGTLDQVDADDPPPQVSLRFSDDRGKSFGDAIIQTAGLGGEYLTQISYNRLGMARDRIFELSWSSPFNTSLNGAFIDVEPLAS